MKMQHFGLYPWPNRRLEENHESHLFLDAADDPSLWFLYFLISMASIWWCYRSGATNEYGVVLCVELLMGLVELWGLSDWSGGGLHCRLWLLFIELRVEATRGETIVGACTRSCASGAGRLLIGASQDSSSEIYEPHWVMGCQLPYYNILTL